MKLLYLKLNSSLFFKKQSLFLSQIFVNAAYGSNSVEMDEGPQVVCFTSQREINKTNISSNLERKRLNCQSARFEWLKEQRTFNESAEGRNLLGYCTDSVTNNPPCCFFLSFMVSFNILIVDSWEVMANWLVRTTQGCLWISDVCCEQECSLRPTSCLW